LGVKYLGLLLGDTYIQQRIVYVIHGYYRTIYVLASLFPSERSEEKKRIVLE
jgi:uncharacterized membrane protein YuzA (DUF378 family)